ncbi:hypothetical protein Q6U63_004348 [Vibrio fluvialis]|nr:hypothetical protein [Vibrio fluvialis]
MSELEKNAKKRHWDLLWNTRLGVRYHMHLQNFYSRVGKGITVLSLVASSAAFATIWSQNSSAAKVLACIVALAQILDLVIDTKGKALLHSSLRQKYLNLELELSDVSQIATEEAKSFEQKRISIEVEEPPVFDSLIDKCHNELVKVYGLDDDQKEPMGKWSSFKAWWFS